MDITRNEGWIGTKKILVILAHPDDPEFFCGAAIARWVDLGHEVDYLLLTTGQRGSPNPADSLAMVAARRKAEQLRAAALLGVNDVQFLDYLAGDLVPDLALRQEVVTRIRLLKPDIVVSCDPQNQFPAHGRINHPDHRAAGQVVVDAVFPAAGNPSYLIAGNTAGINNPHQVEEVWLALTSQPNTALVLTDYLDRKLSAIIAHQSQIHVPQEELRAMHLSRFEQIPQSSEPEYLEKFLRIKFI